MAIDPDIFPTVREQIIDEVINRLGPGGVVPGVVDIFRNGEDEIEGRHAKVGATAGKGVVIMLLEGDDEASPTAQQNTSTEEFIFVLDVIQFIDAEIAVQNGLSLPELAQYHHALVVNAATAIITDNDNNVVEWRSKWNGLALDTMVVGGGSPALLPMPGNAGTVPGVITTLRIRYRHAYGKPGVVA